jgi:hypothetical protein
MTSSRRTFLPRLPSAPAHSAWLALLAVGGAFALFAATQALWPASRTVAIEDAPRAQAAPDVPDASVEPARLRCETCGIVEAIDRNDAGGGKPAGWIFSVRLRDGSLRHTPDALRGRWQVGDGMQLIGGQRTWNVP